MRKFIIPAILSALFSDPANAAVWTIGPGQNHALPCQVSTRLADGYTVEIEAGVYPNWRRGSIQFVQPPPRAGGKGRS